MATFSRVDTIVFDKTGTLTEGKASVTAAKIFTDKDDLVFNGSRRSRIRSSIRSSDTSVYKNCRGKLGSSPCGADEDP